MHVTHCAISLVDALQGKGEGKGSGKGGMLGMPGVHKSKGGYGDKEAVLAHRALALQSMWLTFRSDACCRTCRPQPRVNLE